MRLGRMVIGMAVVCGAACGDGASVDQSGPAMCGELGSATAEGAVAGVMLDPIASALYLETPIFGYAFPLVLEERTLSCAGEATGSGEHLAFLFCAPVAAGEYELVDLESLPEESCPGDLVASGNLEMEDSSDLAGVVSGSITITAAGSCVTGSFSARFEGGGELEGTFDAVTCPAP